MTQNGGCKCPHHKIVTVLVVLFGLLFLGGALDWWGSQVVNVGWPTLVILAGLFKLMRGKCKCCFGGGARSCC